MDKTLVYPRQEIFEIREINGGGRPHAVLARPSQRNLLAMARRISHVIGFDDAPFPPLHRGDVLLVEAVYAGPRLKGVLSDKVRRDRINATRTIVRLFSRSHYRHKPAGCVRRAAASNYCGQPPATGHGGGQKRAPGPCPRRKSANGGRCLRAARGYLVA